MASCQETGRFLPFAPPTDRFMDRVEFDPNGGCWLWSGAQSIGGYGLVKGGGSNHYVHRVSYEANTGPIPDGLFVLHKCDVRACCNPAHLFVGSKRDNAVDAVRKKRWVNNAGERHGMSRLTDAETVEIKQRILSGERQSVIAKEYGVSQSAISNIKTGKRRATNV